MEEEFQLYSWWKGCSLVIAEERRIYKGVMPMLISSGLVYHMLGLPIELYPYFCHCLHLRMERPSDRRAG